MKKHFTFLMLFTLIACNSETPKHASKTNQMSADTLRAILQIKDSIFESSMDAYIEATILNTSKETYKIKAANLQEAILAVQVFDKNGNLIPTVPPSVPVSPEQINYIHIKPMEAFITTYDLHIFDPLLSEGMYTVRMKNMPSNPISFEINPLTND